MQNMGELPQTCHIYVAADGSGDYKTIMEAVDAVPVHNSTTTYIHIKPGVYEERVEISGDKRYIILQGEGDTAKDTKITFGNWGGNTMENGDIMGTFRSATFFVYANHFKAENITFENSYDGTKGGGRQAVAVYASAEHIEFYNCRFIGRQDTLYAKDGTHYYKDCYVEGDVDYIFGGARAVFENCELYSFNIDVTDEGKRAYITAPSTPAAQKYGFLFIECKTTGNFGPDSVFLGRPWHPGADPMSNGSCVFKNCELSEQIREEGWKEHMGGFLSKNARLFEYGCRGAGVKEHERRRVLTDEEAAEYTKEKVLGWDF